MFIVITNKYVTKRLDFKSIRCKTSSLNRDVSDFSDKKNLNKMTKVKSFDVSSRLMLVTVGHTAHFPQFETICVSDVEMFNG